MPARQPEAFIRSYLDDVFNHHDLDHLDTYWTGNLVSNWMGQETLHGLPAWKDAMTGFFTAFPDAAYTLDDLIITADRGVWRGRWRATQRGPWEGIAPTGRSAEWTVIIIARLADNKLAEDWVEYDRLGLYRQLGVIPLARESNAPPWGRVRRKRPRWTRGR